MEWLDKLTGIFDDAGDAVKQAVTDKDLQNKILGNLDKLKTEVSREIYMAELQTKTVPWVDALHKMSRPILNLLTIGAVLWITLAGKQLDPTTALVLGGPTAVYQYIKGKGK